MTKTVMATNDLKIEHEITLGAEPIFHIGDWKVTNALLNSWGVVIFLIIVAVILQNRLAVLPRKLQGLMEMIVEKILDLCDLVTGNRRKSLLIFPIVASLFAFILLNNWSGLLPGVGSIGLVESQNGRAIFVPYFRGGTADLNTTLALAIMAVVGANMFGVLVVGFWKYFNKFININGLLAIPKKIMKDPTIVLVNPVTFFVGLVELIGEVAKVASLSLRLFGNIFAGEVLLSSISVLFAFGAPIPFMFLELIVGVVQALIFSLLTLVYFTVASSDHSEHEEESGETAPAGH